MDMVDRTHPTASIESYQTGDTPAANLRANNQQISLFQDAHHFGIDTATFHTTTHNTTNVTNAQPPTIDPYSILCSGHRDRSYKHIQDRRVRPEMPPKDTHQNHCRHRRHGRNWQEAHHLVLRARGEGRPVS